ncbi:hypothetical protein QVD17_31036 [Tagetes erecta]|uniref:Secreted protein n=1 Tax=Tagetes erecta TaxID=13708 RepID=A0AAD8K3U8_TARER|nr:hypothetical protein QVD17_31036 [Tagetes erecta]
MMIVGMLWGLRLGWVVLGGKKVCKKTKTSVFVGVYCYCCRTLQLVTVLHDYICINITLFLLKISQSIFLKLYTF